MLRAAHAQIYPRAYLDLADEMGVVLLDETAIFEHSIALNFDAPEAWTRFQQHLDGLVLRDAIIRASWGMSFGNSSSRSSNSITFSVRIDRWYRQLADLAFQRAQARFDATMDFVRGGEDFARNTAGVEQAFRSQHAAGSGADIDKPLMVGESGGSYTHVQQIWRSSTATARMKL